DFYSGSLHCAPKIGAVEARLARRLGHVAGGTLQKRGEIRLLEGLQGPLLGLSISEIDESLSAAAAAEAGRVARAVRGLRERQLGRGQGVVLAEYHGVLDRVLELAHVAGPALGREQAHGLGRDLLYRAARARRVLVQKVIGEERHVF